MTTSPPSDASVGTDVVAEDVELGYLARPAAGGPHPGVVLIPDVRGLYDHFRDLARRLAARGFAVLAIDLYRREGSPDLPDFPAILAWMAALDDRRVVGDLAAARRFLTASPAVGDLPVGVIGFCMGGQYTLLAACAGAGFAAAAPFYGMVRYADDVDRARKPRSPLEAIGDLGCPLLGLYGAEDGLIAVADVEELFAKARATGHESELVVYPGAGHAFVNETRPEMHRPDAARDAWERMVAFLTRHLSGAG